MLAGSAVAAPSCRLVRSILKSTFSCVCLCVVLSSSTNQLVAAMASHAGTHEPNECERVKSRAENRIEPTFGSHTTRNARVWKSNAQGRERQSCQFLTIGWKSKTPFDEYFTKYEITRS